MFWPEARIIRLAKASQGCLAFAVVHSPMATESVGENGRGAASKNRSGHFERLSKRRKGAGARTQSRTSGHRAERFHETGASALGSWPELNRPARARLSARVGTDGFLPEPLASPSGSGFACGAKRNLKPPGSAFVGSMAAMVLGRRPSLAA